MSTKEDEVEDNADEVETPADIEEDVMGEDEPPDIEGTIHPQMEQQAEQRQSTQLNWGRRTTQSYSAEFQGDSLEETGILTLGEEDQEVAPFTEEEIDEHIMGVIMTQYAWRTRLR